MTIALRALDIDAVQAFVLVADFGSFTRAAEALDASQAAISLKVKRLEDHLGCRLLDRTPRHVRLSPRGDGFLPGARDLLAAHERAFATLAPPPPRRLSLGISDHIAGPELPNIVARLADHDPALVIEVTIATSRDLAVRFDRAEIDAVIVRRESEHEAGQVLANERFGWFAAPDFQHRQGAPLRLATLAEPCGVRAIVAQLLEEAGIAWTAVYVGGGVMALGAAVSAGLAVAALAHRVAPRGAVEVGAALGLPPLPSADVMLRTRLTDARSQEMMRLVGASFRAAAR